MTIYERQQRRRLADKRRPIYRRACLGCWAGAVLAAFCAGAAPGPLARCLGISLAVLLGAYALHFDAESRRDV